MNEAPKVEGGLPLISQIEKGVPMPKYSRLSQNQAMLFEVFSSMNEGDSFLYDLKDDSTVLKSASLFKAESPEFNYASRTVGVGKKRLWRTK